MLTSSDAESSMYGMCGIIGKSPAMEKVYFLIRQVASTNLLVSISGESGTGKELVARAIHQYSKGNEGQFVPLNCAAIPDNLIESEFFGYVKGAFTDAKSYKPGYLKLADGGTLFLDEVEKIPQKMQDKLLRALENGFYPVGGTSQVITNPRLVSASSRSLEDALVANKLSTEFYYRIRGLPIYLPPLRERGGDISLLAEYYCDVFSKKLGMRCIVTEDAKEILEQYSWPGNIRELRSVIEAAVALRHNVGLEAGKEITLDGLYFKSLFDLYKLQFPLHTPHRSTDTATQDLVEGRAVIYNKQLTLEESLSGRVPRPVIDDIELVRLFDNGTRLDINYAVLIRRLNRFMENRKITAKSLGISVKAVRNMLRRKTIKLR